MIHSGTDFLNINYLFLSIIIYFAANIKLINKLLSDGELDRNYFPASGTGAALTIPLSRISVYAGSVLA